MGSNIWRLDKTGNSKKFAMKKIAIYTCIVGTYDNLMQPQVVYEDCDYICFSDDFYEDKIGVWEIKPIPSAASGDKVRKSRYVKFKPHEVLENYEYSVWIDSNIQILA